MAKEKARYFTFLLYPESIPQDWQTKLEALGVPIAISPLHDKDLSSVEGQKYKKAHYHVIYISKNPVTAESVRLKIKRALGDKSVAKVQIVVQSMENMYLYLTHESKDAIAKNKHKYSKRDITLLNNFLLILFPPIFENLSCIYFIYILHYVHVLCGFMLIFSVC